MKESTLYRGVKDHCDLVRANQPTPPDAQLIAAAILVLAGEVSRLNEKPPVKKSRMSSRRKSK